jgi:Predicted transcriptional regulators
MNDIVGKNLKEFREYNKFTQEQVADFLKLNRSTYSNYELGVRETPLDVLEKCANLFGCDLSLFFEENQDVVKEMLTPAFRIDNITASDMDEIAKFKNIVKNYLKLNNLLAK